MIEMFERHNFHQIVDFSTCGKNTLDLVFELKVENTTAKFYLVSRQLFYSSDHEPILISIKKHREERKTPVSNYFSFCNADYGAMRREKGPCSLSRLHVSLTSIAWLKSFMITLNP